MFKAKFSLDPWVIALIALVGNGIVILQGAVVRATGSGAGCGRHWPTCNGEIIPLNPSIETVIEFSHRLLSSGVLLIGVFLLVAAFRNRKAMPGFFVFAVLSFIFLLIEAALGAVTVLLELTGDDDSLARGLMVPSHLVNSLLLVGALSLSLVYAHAYKRGSAPWPLRIRRQSLLSTVLGLGILGMLFLMFTGGIAALGNTLFPSESLQEGLAADFNAQSHIFIRLRILHPLIAISVGVYLFISLGLSWWMKPVPRAKRSTQALLAVYILQVIVGTFNLAFLAPTVLQILHLLLAVVAFALLSAVCAYSLGGKPEEAPVLKDLKAQATS